MKVDPRFTPAYTVPEEAHYLTVPITTVRSCVHGRPYDTAGGRKLFQPLIKTPERNQLSFVNFVELHVIAALTREFHVPLQKMRRALDHVSRLSPSASGHPLADKQFETDGLD